MVEVAQFPISRLYGHVREFSPAREEEIIVMQQVTDIYGRENGWGCSSHHMEPDLAVTPPLAPGD